MGNKIDSVSQGVYSQHLVGTARRYNRNPTNDRFGTLQRMYIRVLTEMAANRFKWEGLPDSVDVRFMELTLFHNALSVFYFDFRYGKYFALQGSANGIYNMMQQPTSFFVTGNMFTSKTLKSSQCIPIWSNYLRIPDIDIVMIYSSKLADIDLSIEIMAHNARNNKVLAYDENQKLSVENLNRQLDEGQMTVRVSSEMGADLNSIITSVDLGIDMDSIEKLHIVRTRLWSECMGLLGIDNSNQDKKERLVAAEVDGNNEQVSAMKAVNLNARQAAAHQISERYGLSVSVEYNQDNTSELNNMDTDPAEAIPTKADYASYPKHLSNPEK